MEISDEILEHMQAIALDTMPHSNITDPKYIFGAAVLGGSGTIYGGCSYDGCPMDYCAERVALLKALSEGEKEIVAILTTYNGNFEDADDLGGMCGVCLNTIYQLGGQNTALPIFDWPSDEESYRTTTLGDLYPVPF